MKVLEVVWATATWRGPSAGRVGPGRQPEREPAYLWSLVHGLAELWRLGSFTGLPAAGNGLRPLAERVLAAALP